MCVEIDAASRHAAASCKILLIHADSKSKVALITEHYQSINQFICIGPHGFISQ